MEWNEWNDGDAGDPEDTHNRDFDPWPPAPLPPHERTWRHPSELGATTVHIVTRPQPALSRKATVATVAVGVLLVAGAVRLMVPSTGTRTASSEPVATLSIVTTAVQELTTTQPVVAGPGPTTAHEGPGDTEVDRAPDPTMSSPRATTTLVAHVTTAEPEPPLPPVAEYTMLGTASPTYALVLQSGRYLATSAAAVDGMETVEVQMPSGERAQATVLRATGPIALLDLAGASAEPAPHGVRPAEGDVVLVGSPDGQVVATVGEGNAEGYHLLTSDEPLHESGPVYDADGVVIGICTRSHDAAWLVPIDLLDDLADLVAEEPTTTTVVSTTPGSEPSSTTSSPPASTSSTTSTTVPGTTSTTISSTTRPPTTTAPTTSTPRSTAPGTMPPVPVTTG